MLQVNSDLLLEYLLALDKKLTKTLKRDTSITIQSTNNGIECVLNGTDFKLIHVVPDMAESDGQITLDFDDLISSLSQSSTIDIREVDDNVVLVNQLPVFKLEYNSLSTNSISNDTVELSGEDCDKYIDELVSYRRVLKKSIFDESSYVLSTFMDGFINFRVVNPIEYNSSMIEINGFHPTLDLYVDKQRLKLMELFFKKSDIAISENKLSNKDYELFFEEVELNRKLYFPDEYAVKSYD